MNWLFWKRKLRRAEEEKRVDNSLNPALELCYTDKSGRRYYKWRNPTTMDALRYLVGWSAIEYANMGVTPKDAREHLKKALDAINTGQLAQAGYYVQGFLNRIDKADPDEAYLSLAACYSLLENENPITYDQETAALKQSLWRLDLDAKAFFLNFAFRTSAILTKSLNENTPSVLLTQMLQTMKLLSSILPKESQTDSTN